MLNQCEKKLKINIFSIEKDWWVTQVLKSLSKSQYSKDLIFKGGTSLSKGWDIIKRFSEDIDIAINREFLGFGGELTKNKISDKLRRASCSFVRNDFRFELEKQLLELGIPSEYFKIDVYETGISTTDPEIIEIAYDSVVGKLDYLRDKIILEVGARSIFEPWIKRQYSSILAMNEPNYFHNEVDFFLQTAPPSRTFLEKVFLIHEEFSKPFHEIRIDRMSRHLYDIEKLMNTPFATEALNNQTYYLDIIAHRKKFIGLKNFNYLTLMPTTINIIPPLNVRAKYAIDYKRMQESMIYEKTLEFEDLLVQISRLNNKINEINWV